MAVLLRLVVGPGSKEQCYAFEELVEQAIAGGHRPDGLMCHVVYPNDHGFVIDNVWGREADGLSFHEAVMQPRLAQVGVPAGLPEIHAVWAFARP